MTAQLKSITGAAVAVDEGANAVFAARGWLAAAEPRLRDKLLAAGRPVDIERGARLFSPGAPPGGVFGVIAGGIAVEGGSPWHQPRIGHVYRAGHWFGHGPALSGGRRTMGYSALEDSQLLTIPLPALQALMQADQELTRLVGAMADIGTRLANWTACDLLIPDAPHRIAAVLLRITGAHEGIEPTDPRGFLITQVALAEMANASRPHVNRVLGQFAREGWIAKSYNHLRIVDFAALSGFAYSSE